MNPESFWDVVKRRWFVSLISLLVALSATALLILLTPARWEGSGSILLVYPTSTDALTGKAAARNPFLLYQDGKTVAQAVVQRLSGTAVRDSILRGVEGADYTLSTSTENNASAQIIYLTVSAESASLVASLDERLRSTVSAQLTAMQVEAGADRRALIATIPAGRSSGPVVSPVSQIRSAVAVLGAALVLWLVLLRLLEAGARRQQKY